MSAFPESDRSIIELLSQGLYEVPNMARRGVSMPDTSNRTIDPDEEILRDLAGITDPYELVPEPRRTELFRRAAKSDSVRRAAESDAEI